MAGEQRLKNSSAPEPFDLRVRLRRYLRVLWVCRASAASVALGLGLAFLTPVHDLFLDISGVDAPDLLGHPFRDLAPPLGHGLVLALLVTAFWALPVHAIARLAVSDPNWLGSPYQPRARRDYTGAAERFAAQAKWIPRLLGLLCYVAAILAALLAWRNLPIVADEPLGLRVRNAIFADVGFLAAFAVLFAAYAIFRRGLINFFSPKFHILPPPRIGLSGDGELRGARIDRGIALAVFALLVAALIFPALLDYFPRLWLVPLMLGIWTPILGTLARYGYRWRLPLGLIALAALVTVFYRFGDNHVSDIIAKTAPQRLTLVEAIKRWKAANCDGDACPSPIVALVSGGASRSGFFAVSALGLLTDVSCEGESETSCASPLFARRLFAVSSVSGGSVGAAVYAKALADRGPNGAPPCLPDRPSHRYFRADRADWRGCLQKILAEDFLSPVIAGLGFRDVLGFIGAVVPGCWWPDRGRRIETAIAQAYLRFAGAPESGCPAERRHGLDTPFAALGDPKSWSPVLMLNSTTSESGKRFVFSGISPYINDGPTRWLQDAYDFHESFPGSDIRLVAAAHNSARFPVISPAGALYGPPQDPPPAKLVRPEPLTKLVDGGYFDNYGASTARDLAEALQGQGLKPFILLIANNPSVDDHAAFAAPNSNGRPLDLSAEPPSWIPPLVAAPAKAILAASSARGDLSMEQLRRAVDPIGAPPAEGDHSCLGAPRSDAPPCFAMIAVHEPNLGADESADKINARVSGVSMSWWLSKPVQQYLDNQLELPSASEPGGGRQRALARGGYDANAAAMMRVCDVLGSPRFAALCHARIVALAHDGAP